MSKPLTGTVHQNEDILEPRVFQFLNSAGMSTLDSETIKDPIPFSTFSYVTAFNSEMDYIKQIPQQFTHNNPS